MASFYPYLYEAALALCIDARIKAGLTQAQLAERFGQTEGFVASYESGGRLLDPAEYIAIEPSAFKCTRNRRAGDSLRIRSGRLRRGRF